jgi:hypothetical protein
MKMKNVLLSVAFVASISSAQAEGQILDRSVECENYYVENDHVSLSTDIQNNEVRWERNGQSHTAKIALVLPGRAVANKNQDREFSSIVWKTGGIYVPPHSTIFLRPDDGGTYGCY